VGSATLYCWIFDQCSAGCRRADFRIRGPTNATILSCGLDRLLSWTNAATVARIRSRWRTNPGRGKLDAPARHWVVMSAQRVDFDPPAGLVNIPPGVQGGLHGGMIR
jgi:hypothetical protein